MAIDPFRLAIAVVPLAAYLILLGLVNLRRRPLLTNGGSDLTALAAAVSGLVFIGPIELFRPAAATAQFGNYVWLFLLAFYWLWVSLAVLLSRPRLVVYNITADQLHPLLAQVASELDGKARWVGGSVTLPACQVQLHLDVVPSMRNVSLVSSGSRQSLEGWQKLGKSLSQALDAVTVTPNPRAVSMLIVAGLLLTGSMLHMLNHPVEVSVAMRVVRVLSDRDREAGRWTLKIED